MVEPTNPIAQLFVGVVQAISNVAGSLGQPAAGVLNGFLGQGTIDATLGTTIIILIAGAFIWRFVESSAIRYAALVVLGAALFAVFSVPPQIGAATAGTSTALTTTTLPQASIVPIQVGY